LPGRPRQRLIRIVAKRAILAAGAIERPLVFGGNDRPGIMLAGAVRTYLNRFGVKPGESAVVFANNDDAARTALDLAACGVTVAALVDPRPSIDPALQAAIEATGTRVLTNAVIAGAKGSRRVTQVEVMGGDGSRQALDCDLVAMSGGWSPSIHLTCHLGGRGRWHEGIAAFLPGNLPPGMTVIGTANGRFGLGQALREAAEAGVAAASDCGFEAKLPAIPEVEKTPEGASPLWRVAKPLSKAFVDFQNDVTHRDIELAAREGFRSVEHVKRYTTLGMATDQGKTSNVNAIGIMAEISGKEMGEVGTTTYRPPYTPLSLGALAGHGKGKDFRPTRLTPSHRWAEEQGAVFVESGAWLRAQYFPKPGETDWLTTVNREVIGVRSAVGVCDVSTLGKIDVQGADAVQFLERLYINGWKSLAVGRARYGVMLREDGFVLDDGTTARLGEDRFFMTTTTANAARVYQHMQFCHQCLWPDLDVQFTSITDQWAQFAVAGPRSRDVLRVLVDPHHDISNEAFPYLTAAELSICGGVKVRLFRISFSGELAYELSVPARYGDAVIRRLMLAGRDFGILPYGTEALGVMRVEKGHLGGSELNGQTTARDLGLGRMAASNKDYIGRALTARPALVDPDRPIFVGFKPVDRSARLRAGAHFVPEGTKPTAADDEGHMTSVAYSPMLGHWIGLGLLKRGAERIGERVRAYDPVRNGDVLVEICSPAFYDPQGERLRV
jgi:sarcosine oxidase subunit alpha